MTRRFVLSLALAFPLMLPLVGCPQEGTAPVAEAEAEAKLPAELEPAAEAAVYALKCGCALDTVGHCSEWAQAPGSEEWLEITPDLGLGSMPFCHKEGLKARIEGEVQDGKLITTAFAYVEE